MGESLEAAKGSVWALFLTAHAVLVEKIEVRLGNAGLPPLAWYDVLWALERAGDRRLRMGELADMAVITRSNLTRLVDRLEAAGLVERERAEDDRRGAFALITAQGRAMRRKMWPFYAAAIKELFEDHITERDATQMGGALRRIVDAVNDRTAEN
ncbi:MAG: MarR family transcriptional regulator [Betaproteobacteria bacterium]